MCNLTSMMSWPYEEEVGGDTGCGCAGTQELKWEMHLGLIYGGIAP